MSWKRNIFDVRWDVDKYKSNYDSEHWDLCRLFMVTHKTKYPEQKLANLTEAFYQMGVYGSSYDPRTTRLVNALTIEVLDDVLKNHPGTLPHPFDKSAVVVTEEVSTGAKDKLSKENSEPSKPSSIWDTKVDTSIIVNVLNEAQMKELLKGFLIIYDIRRTSTLNDNKVSILEESFKRSKFGPCYWSKDDTNNNICPIRMSLKWRNVVLAEAVGADEKSLKTRISQAILNQIASFSSGIEAKWNYYRDGRQPDRFDSPNPRKSNIYRVMRRSQFKAMAEVISFIDTFANSDSFAEAIFGMDYSTNEKKQLMEYINKNWHTKLTYRTISKTGVKNNSESHVFVYHIRSGEELRRWLEESGGENDRYRMIPPGKHRRTGSSDSNVREVLTTDAVEMPKEKLNEVVNKSTEKQDKESENKQKDTNKKDEEKLKSSHESEDNLEKLLDGFVLFYDANKTSEIDKDDWFTALCESFKLSKYGALEVITENVRALRTRCVFKWKDKVLASAEGLTETQAKTAATLQLISKLEPFTYIIQAKEDFFCGGKVPKCIEDPDKNKSNFFRIVRRKDLPNYYSIFHTIDEFARKKSYDELVFGSDFTWELKNEIVVYLKAKGLSHRYFTSNNQKPWTHMAVYHNVIPEELKDYLLKNGGENEKYKLIPPPKAEPIVDKTSQDKSSKEAQKSSTSKRPPVKVAEKRKEQEPEALAEDLESNKIQIKLKKFKVDKVEYPEDTGGDFPGLILWIGIRKNSVWQKTLFNILMDSFKMSKYPELVIEESEETVWGRKEPFKKCVMKSNRKVLAVGLGESKTEAKNSASLQVLRQLRKHCFTIQAKESYFKEGKATPYNFHPDSSKSYVYKVIKRAKFKDRASIIKFVNDFSKNPCPEEVIFGDDFSYDEREFILDHCRKIDLNYRLMKCQSVSKNMHTHIAIFHQQPLPVIKAELMKAGGENDMYRLIPPGGKITNQNNEADLWPDSLENEKDVPSSGTKTPTGNLPVQQNVISQSNEPQSAKKQIPPLKNVTTNQTSASSNPIPSLINRTLVVGPSLTLNFDQKGTDIDNFAPSIHMVDSNNPDRKQIPVKISRINAERQKNQNVNTSLEMSNNQKVEDTSEQSLEYQTGPQPLQIQQMGPHPPQNQAIGPEPQFLLHPQEVQVPFQEVPFGPQPLFSHPLPMYGQPFMDTPLQFGPHPPAYSSQPLCNMGPVTMDRGMQPINTQMEMANQSMPSNVQMSSITSQANKTQIVVPSVTVTVQNSPQQTDLREELAKKRQVENQKSSPDRNNRVHDVTAERRVINTDDNDSWSRKVFVSESKDDLKREEPRAGFVGQSNSDSKDKSQDLREKLKHKEPKGSGEPTHQRKSPQRNIPNKAQRRGERGRYIDRPVEEIVRHREGSYERRVFHDSSRGVRDDYDRIDSGRFRSRSPQFASRGLERSLSPRLRCRDLWDNIPRIHSETIFMYKYVKQDSTMETDPYALLRATLSLSYNIDFDFIKEQTAIDEWYVSVELMTDDINMHPLVGEGVARSEREASLRAAYHAVDTIQKACHVIEPNYRYFCEGGVPEFIVRKSPMKTSVYEIIQNLDPGTPLARYTIDMMFQMFMSSDLEDLFFLASDFSYVERVTVVEMATQMNLGWRIFGPRHPDARTDDVISTQHVCVYKQKSALQLVRELIARGGSTEKYSLVDPREYRLTQPRGYFDRKPR